MVCFPRVRLHAKINQYILSHFKHKLFVSGSDGDGAFSLNITNDDGPQPIVVETSFTISSEYPNEIPTVSLHCTSMTKSSSAQLKTSIMQHADSLKGEPMLMDLILYIKDHCKRYITCNSDKMTETCSEDTHNDNQTVLLHLDHMRSKVKYIKTLQKWAPELSINGKFFSL